MRSFLVLWFCCFSLGFMSQGCDQMKAGNWSGDPTQPADIPIAIEKTGEIVGSIPLPYFGLAGLTLTTIAGMWSAWVKNRDATSIVKSIEAAKLAVPAFKNAMEMSEVRAVISGTQTSGAAKIVDSVQG